MIAENCLSGWRKKRYLEPSIRLRHVYKDAEPLNAHRQYGSASDAKASNEKETRALGIEVGDLY